MERKKISQIVQRYIYIRSYNCCAMPGCGAELCKKDGTLIGEICHIEGIKPGSARYNPNLSEEKVNDTSNLILLCRNHHKEIDQNPEKYTVEKLKQIKEAHEERASQIWRTITNKPCQEVEQNVEDSDKMDENEVFYTELTRIFQNCHFDEVFLRQSFDAPFNDKYFDYMSDGYYAIRELMNEECAVKIPGAVKKELLGMADLIEYMATGIAMCFDSNGGGFAIPNAGRWDKQNAEATEYNLNLIRGIYQKYRFR